jgi:hypothetical protein
VVCITIAGGGVCIGSHSFFLSSSVLLQDTPRARKFRITK